ncbi:MAG: hypothetical protein JSU92_02245 [Deltaproteobacteria bacterium]|nr:MAG: hypothetical protein JSU92_02245 [Deltaproteobacteria bacterium]
MNFSSKVPKYFLTLITVCLVLISYNTSAIALSEGDCINTSPVVLTGTITDASGIDPDSVVVMVDGSTPGPGQFTYTTTGEWTATFTLSDDLHTLIVEATDGCGNTGNKSIGFRVDTTHPEVSITSPTDVSTVYSSTIIVTGTVTDTGSGPTSTADVELDGITIQTASISAGDFTAIFNALPDGIHTFIATVRDNCGNTANSATVKVVIKGMGCSGLIAAPSGIVDDLGNVGGQTSLEFNYCSFPRISYYDMGNSNLKYASWTGTNWDIQTVDDTGSVGLYTSLALDKNGYPRISYYDVGNGDLRYAVWDGSGWRIQTVDSDMPPGNWSSLYDTIIA